MKDFLTNDRASALIIILVLAVGSLAGIGTAKFVMGLDGGNINGSIIACNYGACKDNTFNGGTSGGGQPTPSTATLIVTKKLICAPLTFCPANGVKAFNFEVSGNNPSPKSFTGSATGVEVTLGPGDYTVTETLPAGTNFKVSFSGDCNQIDSTASATGNIKAGNKQTCQVTNDNTP